MRNRVNRSDADFSEEIRAHIQIEADRLVEEGMSREQAIDAARRAFGNVTQSSERFYEASRWMWLDHLARDVRFAWRQMKSSPLSTATMIVVAGARHRRQHGDLFACRPGAAARAAGREPEQLVQLDWNGLFVGAGMGSVGTGSLIPYLLYRDLRRTTMCLTDMFARSPADMSPPRWQGVGGGGRRDRERLVLPGAGRAAGSRPADRRGRRSAAQRASGGRALLRLLAQRGWAPTRRSSANRCASTTTR